MTITRNERRAQREGMRAKADRRPIDSCPYAYDSDEGISWRAGWRCYQKPEEEDDED